MKIPNILAGAILLPLCLVFLSGCQTFLKPTEETRNNIATVINQTDYILEVQQQGNYEASLAAGETYHLQAPTESTNSSGDSVTLVILAYQQQGEYIGTSHRAFRPRTFAVWEVTPDILNRIDKTSIDTE